MPKPARVPTVVFVTKPPSTAGIGTLHKTPGAIESLAKSLDAVARDNDRNKARVFDKAASLKELTAHEVSKLEAMRNHADSRAQQHTKDGR